MASIDLTLVSKPGCHLCDDARAVVLEVIAAVAPLAVEFREVSIFDDQALYDEHVEDIPVVLIDGRVHTFWRVDPARLTAALRAAPSHPSNASPGAAS
ncbi:thioredoxin family protein [Subtercola sp. Z020]|uniref:glutaredoxin family protein n=1 Tax=Subtercola sp. Z020 TaxID=2080582 RepID=UPI000CE77505|nr:glutaredoxin family protein [Subtercola sp. Z020]PPF80767.1 thioredoxin family protein [Subtercola sp. Z020]